jgi:hypothetical protein
MDAKASRRWFTVVSWAVPIRLLTSTAFQAVDVRQFPSAIPFRRVGSIMLKRFALAAVVGLLQVGIAHANFVLVGPSYSATVGVAQWTSDVSTLDLSGVFDTNFVLNNSDGTQSYHSNGQITLSGPGGIAFTGNVVDQGLVPAGSGFVQATHSTPFDFLIALSPPQQALFQGSGTTNVNVALINYSTTGPTSSTALYSWDVSNGSVSAVPLPAALPLLFSGLATFGVFGRRRTPVRG